MKKESFFGNTKLLCSDKAENGAKHLVENLENGTLQMDILPNRYERFSGKLEEEDYVSYCRFLRSSNGKKILNMLEVEDAGDFAKL